MTDFTPDVCAAFLITFIKTINTEFNFTTGALAIYNRSCSHVTAQACAEALKQLNISEVYYGVIPTASLAYNVMSDNVTCIMVI